MTFRSKRVVSALILAGALAFTGCATPEDEFPEKTTFVRGASGLGALSTTFPERDGVYNKALEHSRRMCAFRGIWHTTLSDYPAGNWRQLGENVGFVYWNQADPAASTQQLFQKFWDSPGHRNNLLGPYTHHVIAQHICEDGQIYVTHVFIRY